MKKTFNKLVRDKIPAICVARGATPQTRILTDDREYLKALCAKLLEEAEEVRDDPSLEELADVQEVVNSIAEALGLTPDQIEKARKQKAKERGGFRDRIFLISTKE